MLKENEKREFDYIGAYEKALKDVVSACGSRETANKLMTELERQYETTEKELEKLDKNTPEYDSMKNIVLGRARESIHSIIEKYLPHTSDHMKELILGASLAISAVLLPAAATASLLMTASSIVAIGGSYYIGFKLLSNWKTMTSKNTIARMTGKVSHKSVKGLGIKLLKKK
jgi:hypothetical protein